MAYRFVFETDEVFQGDICEAYDGFPANASELSGEAPPFATTTVAANRQVSVSAGERPSIALVLKRDGFVYARSNSFDLADLDEDAVTGVHIALLQDTFSQDELSSFVPDVPFSEDGVTVTSAKLSVAPPHLVIEGTAKTDVALGFTLDFKYTFDLVRTTRPLWLAGSDDAFVTVREVDFEVGGAGVLQDVLLALFKGTVRRKFEGMLNAKLNEAIRELLPAGVKGTLWAAAVGTDPKQVDAGAGVTVTVVKTEVRITLYVWSWEPLCPFESSVARSTRGRTGKHTRTRSRTELDQLRDVRARLLAPTTRGQAHLRVYKEHLAEIGKLLRTVPTAAGAFEGAVARFVQDNPPGTSDPRLSPEGGELARELANALLPHASPGLRGALRELLDQMGPDLRERRLRDLLADLP